MAKTVEGGMDRLRKYDNNPDNQKNNMTGWSGDLKDDSWEAEEERRIESERLAKLEKERLAKLEAEKIEREKLAQQKAKREAQLAQEAQIKAQQEDPRNGIHANMLRLFDATRVDWSSPASIKNTEILNKWVQANKHRKQAFIVEIGNSAIVGQIEFYAKYHQQQAAARKK
jgi:hypothetical protein